MKMNLHLFNETNIKKFKEFLKSTYRKKTNDKFPLLNKINKLKKKGKIK